MALFAVGMWLFLYAMPRYGDDIGYLHLFQRWFADRGVFDTDEGVSFSAGFPWRELADTWVFRFYDDNARLAMFFSPLFMLFPKWAGATVMALLLLVTVRVSLAVAGIDWHRSALVPILLVLVMAVLPWRDGLSELVFQLNYIPATACAILLIAWLKNNEAVKQEASPAVCVMAFVFGFLTGWWHEGIALPVGCGLIAVVAVRGIKFERRALWASVGLVAAGVSLFLVPGMRARIARTDAPSFGLVELAYFVMAAWPCLLTLIWAAVHCVRARFGRNTADRLVIFGVVSCVVSLAIALRSGQFLRAGWWAYFITCVLAVYLARTGFPKFWERYSLRNSLIWAPLLTITFIQFGVSDCYALRIRHIAGERLRAWRESHGRAYFADISQSSDIPAICGFLPYYGWHTDIYYESLRLCDINPAAFGGYDDLWGVVPEALRDVDRDSGEPVPGGSGVRSLDGYLFVDEEGAVGQELARNDCSVSDWEMMIDYGSGPRPVRVRQVSFRSERDGRRFSYLDPALGWRDAHFGQLRAISPGMRFVAPDR